MGKSKNPDLHLSNKASKASKAGGGRPPVVKKKISQTCPMYLTTLLLAPGLWQWPEQTAVGREGRRLITRRIQVPAETRGKCKWARAQR